MRILYIRENNSGCGYYRCFVPALFLNCSGHQVDFSYRLKKQHLKEYDIIFLQRAYSPFLIEILEEKRDAKLYYDIDDLLTGLYNEHHMFDFYKEKKKDMETIISLCDGIISPSQILLEKLSYLNKNQIYFPNLLINNFETNTVKKDKKSIIFAGTRSHKEDYKKYSSVFKKLREDHGIKMIFFGFKPDDFDESWMEYIEPVSIFDYQNRLSEIDASIGLALLENNEFKRSKSVIKFAEYSSAGIISVLSEVGAFKDIPDEICIKIDSKESLFNSIEQLMNKQDHEILNKTRGYIKENFHISIAAKYLSKITDFEKDFTFNKEIYNNLKKRFLMSDDLNDIIFSKSNYYIVGNSQTANEIVKIFKDRKITINGVVESDDDIPKDSNVIICSKGYPGEIKSKLNEKSIKNIYSVY